MSKTMAASGLAQTHPGTIAGASGGSPGQVWGGAPRSHRCVTDAFTKCAWDGHELAGTANAGLLPDGHLLLRGQHPWGALRAACFEVRQQTCRSGR